MSYLARIIWPAGISLIKETFGPSNCTRETKRGLESKAIIRALATQALSIARDTSQEIGVYS